LNLNVDYLSKLPNLNRRYSWKTKPDHFLDSVGEPNESSWLRTNSGLIFRCFGSSSMEKHYGDNCMNIILDI
jgi:hypothetical protein